VFSRSVRLVLALSLLAAGLPVVGGLAQTSSGQVPLPIPLFSQGLVSGGQSVTIPSGVSVGGSVTAVVWVKSKVGNPNGVLVRLGSLGASRNSPYGEDHLTFYGQTFGVRYPENLRGSVNVHDGGWHQVAVTSNGLSGSPIQTLFVDGLSVVTQASGWDAGDGKLAFGEAAGWEFKDVAVYDSALAASVLSDLFAVNITGARCGTVAPSGVLQDVANAGAVSMWRLNDGGRVVRDLLPGCRNGEYGGASTSVVGGHNSTVGRALATGGYSSQIGVAGAVTGPVSVMVWARTPVVRGGDIVRLGSMAVTRTTPYDESHLAINGDLFGAKDPENLAGSTNIWDGLWHQYVLTSGGPALLTRLYVDGHYVTSTSTPWSLEDPTLSVGALGGEFDDLALFNKQLSPLTVRDLFVTGITEQRCGNSQPAQNASPVAVWPLEQDGRVATDTVGCKNGAVGASPVLVTGQPAGKAIVTGGHKVRTEVSGAVVDGGAVTLTFWVQTQTAPGLGLLAGVGSLSVARYDAYGEQHLLINNNTYNPDHLSVAGVNTEDGKWHHFAITHDGVNTARFYVDGKYGATSTGPWNLNNGLLEVGGATGRAFDNTQLHGITMTDAQIADNYNQGLVANPTFGISNYLVSAPVTYEASELQVIPPTSGAMLPGASQLLAVNQPKFGPAFQIKVAGGNNCWTIQGKNPDEMGKNATSLNKDAVLVTQCDRLNQAQWFYVEHGAPSKEGKWVYEIRPFWDVSIWANFRAGFRTDYQQQCVTLVRRPIPGVGYTPRLKDCAMDPNYDTSKQSVDPAQYWLVAPGDGKALMFDNLDDRPRLPILATGILYSADAADPSSANASGKPSQSCSATLAKFAGDPDEKSFVATASHCVLAWEDGIVPKQIRIVFDLGGHKFCALAKDVRTDQTGYVEEYDYAFLKVSSECFSDFSLVPTKLQPWQLTKPLTFTSNLKLTPQASTISFPGIYRSIFGQMVTGRILLNNEPTITETPSTISVFISKAHIEPGSSGGGLISGNSLGGVISAVSVDAIGFSQLGGGLLTNLPGYGRVAFGPRFTYTKTNGTARTVADLRNSLK
jgi:Concanavalin A-like lectin/glucanases superfamily